MIEKKIYGNPVETGAVAAGIDGTREDGWPFAWRRTMRTDDIVFGLGENMHGINKRGFRYVSWCSDVPNQGEFTPSMYGSRWRCQRFLRNLRQRVAGDVRHRL